MAQRGGDGGTSAADGWRGKLAAGLDQLSFGTVLLVVAATLVFAGLFAAGTRTPATSAGAVPSGIVLPPAGLIWFGAALDARTFALSGRSDHTAIGATCTAVARLTRPIADGEATVEVVLGTTVLAANPLRMAASGPRDVVSWTFAVPVGGTFHIAVLDAAGAVLASGTVTAP